MSRAQILRIIRLIATAARLRMTARGFKPAGMCGDLTSDIAGALDAIIPEALATQISGWIGDHHHMWVKLQGNPVLGVIVDATGDQFNDRRVVAHKMPAVYVGPKPNWYQESSHAN
jgi:hypothetical protein